MQLTGRWVAGNVQVNKLFSWEFSAILGWLSCG